MDKIKRPKSLDKTNNFCSRAREFWLFFSGSRRPGAWHEGSRVYMHWDIGREEKRARRKHLPSSLLLHSS